MSLIAFLIIGLLAGLIARALMPGPQPMGLLATMALGCAGSFIGGMMGSFFSYRGSWLDFHPTGLIWSTLGALVLLALASLGNRRMRV